MSELHRPALRRRTLTERRLMAVKEGLPSEAEYDALTRQASALDDALGAALWRLEHLVDDGDVGSDDDESLDALVAAEAQFTRERPVPTITDVGVLFSYVEGLDSAVGEFEHQRDRFRSALTLLDETRRNAEIRAKAKTSKRTDG
ncbi:MAG: hypothetical protein ABR521_02755 [Gaiellaceae bacterium]